MPERAALARARPERGPGRRRRGSTRSGRRARRPRPRSANLRHVAADEADRPEQREQRRERAEERASRATCASKPKTLVGEQRRRRSRSRSARRSTSRGTGATLSTVARYEPRWPSGARSSTIAGTRRRRRSSRRAPSMRVADQAADERGEQRLAEREVEARRAETMTSSETPRFAQSSERVARGRARAAAPERARCPSCGVSRSILPPFAGTNRIRFDGCDLSPAGRAPR